MDAGDSAKLTQLAQTVSHVSGELQDVRNRLHVSTDDAERHTGFRLDDLVGELRTAARELAHTATELTRLHSIRGQVERCQADWGVCPEHGGTLTSSAGTSVCRVDGRSWDHDRLGRPCGEPATEVVTDPAGGTARMCHGHALAAPDDWHVHTPTSEDCRSAPIYGSPSAWVCRQPAPLGPIPPTVALTSKFHAVSH